MTETKLIDGKAVAEKLRRSIAADVAALKAYGQPSLAVVLVGDDPASGVYVRNKARQTVEAGMQSFEHRLSAEVTQEDLTALVHRLNNDGAVHGILVQLPLPPHLSTEAVIAAIDPAKDVDGFHVINAGRLATGTPAFVPCTPVGCMMLLQSVTEDLRGMSAIVIGRSNIVGKPMAQLLLKNDCTVTMAHSQTRDLPDECRRADIVVAAVGRPGMIRGSWLKPGAIVIDVGINRIGTSDGKSRLVGDVAFDEALGIAGHITPVPGGVGPMTIACLLANTLTAFKNSLAGVQDTGRRAS